MHFALFYFILLRSQFLSFFASFSKSLLFAITKLIKVLYHIWLNLHVFFLILIWWIFRGQLLLHQYLIAIRFEQDMKIVFEIDASFLWCGVDFRKNVRVNVLKYVFVLRQILLKHSKIFFSLIDKSTNYLEHTRMTDILTVEINKFFSLQICL